MLVPRRSPVPAWRLRSACQQMVTLRQSSDDAQLRSHQSLNWDSRSLRRTFLDFFSSTGHVVVPSAPVIPYQDPSLVFTNAGMNQFKSVFLGFGRPPAPQVANVQKCIRLGGRHNDLDMVGLDGSHHTFFEMMGNWTFEADDSLKFDACRAAWKLMTEAFEIPADKLFVTYFDGCPTLGLPADEETKQAWLDAGVASDRVLPFGAEYNFWEMGSAGPCGPCAEIHFDHAGRGCSAVNTGRDDLVEVGNLVFMEFLRDAPGKNLTSLKKKHLDTGFGLERLTAIKRGSTSNYDSDLFAPIFATISQCSGVPSYSGQFLGPDHLDTKQRILADHARMMVACVADGMFPDSSLRLRHIMKRALTICNEFGCDYRLLEEVGRAAANVLVDQYPEMAAGAERLPFLVKFIEEHVRQSEAASTRALPKLQEAYPHAKDFSFTEADKVYEALKVFERSKRSTLSGDLAAELHACVGIGKDGLRVLARIKDVHFDEIAFEEALIRAKQNIKYSSARNLETVRALPKTDNSFVWQYTSSKEGKYQFPLITAKVLAIEKSDQSLCESLKEGEEGVVYLDKTTFYAESGGQIGDSGELVTIDGASFAVTNCRLVMDAADHVAHVGQVIRGNVDVGSDVKLKIHTAHRLGCMQNHTATHLLNQALHRFLPITCQTSSHVDHLGLRLGFSAFTVPVDVGFLTRVEEEVHQRIAEGGPVEREVMHLRQALTARDLVTLPGEQYPDDLISIVTVPGGQREPCCGTHLVRTSDIQSFAIVGVKSAGTGVKVLHCLTGSKAAAAREKGIKLIEEVFDLHNKFTVLDAKKQKPVQEVTDLLEMMRTKRQSLKRRVDIPFAVQHELIAILKEMVTKLSIVERRFSKASMLSEMETLIEDSSHELFVVHNFNMTDSKSKVLLSKITRICPDKPVLISAVNDSGVYARACVPKDQVTECFDAEKWLDCVGSRLGEKASAPRGQDSSTVCNLAIKDSSRLKKAKEEISDAMTDARSFAERHLGAAISY